MKRKSPNRKLDRKGFLRLSASQDAPKDLHPDVEKALQGARQLENPAEFAEMLDRLDLRVKKRTSSGNGQGGSLRWLPITLAAAASVCLLVFFGPWKAKTSPGQLAYENFDPIPSEKILRSSSPGYGSLQLAWEYYEARDFEDAIPYFKNALDSFNQDSSKLNLYYGISLLGDHQASSAIPPLKKVSGNKEEPEPVTRAATWYLALAQLADGDTEASRRTLDILADKPGDFQNEAHALRNELDGVE